MHTGRVRRFENRPPSPSFYARPRTGLAGLLPHRTLFYLLLFAAIAQTPTATPREVATPPASSSPLRFVNRTDASGLGLFRHCLGSREKRWIVDAMGSGVCVGDYDNDDDIYLVNGRPDLQRADPRWRNALFRNDGDGFVDVTENAGVGDLGFGMCALFGDVDNDGWLDLFVGNVGPNALYRNNRDGTFTDATQESGLGDDRYAASAAFADVDRDGDLDLYLGNYVDFDPVEHGNLRALYHGQEVLMGPMAFKHQRDILYTNDGAGRFTDVSGRAQINVSQSRAMGTVFFDIENDGHLDLYVTNDSTYNYVLRGRGDGTFEDLSFLSGAGFSDGGYGGASMGVSTGDFDNDGRLDLYITSYEDETDILYRNQGDGLLSDHTAVMRLLRVTRSRVTWGSGFCDFDADGFLDLYTANGHVYPQVDRLDRERGYAQGVSVYRHTGERFEDISEFAVPPEVMKRSGRGSALLDYDSDGDMDIVVNCMDASPLLLENQSPRGNWLQLVLEGLSAQTFGLRVVARSGSRRWTRIVDGGSGYLSQNSQTLHFGFGQTDRLDDITVHWPHRSAQVIPSPTLNRRIRLKSTP